MLCKKQFGFRHDHSATTHALLELTEKIRDSQMTMRNTLAVYFVIYKRPLIL